MQILTRFNKVIAYSPYGYTPVGNSAICAVTNECYDDALIVTVERIPTDIDRYDYYYINGKFIKGSPNSVLREANNYNKLQLWVGTQAEYNALKDEEKTNLFALITDDTTYDDLDRRINANYVKSRQNENAIAGMSYNNKTTHLNQTVADFSFYLDTPGVYSCVVQTGQTSPFTRHCLLLHYDFGVNDDGASPVYGIPVDVDGYTLALRVDTNHNCTIVGIKNGSYWELDDIKNHLYVRAFTRIME